MKFGRRRARGVRARVPCPNPRVRSPGGLSPHTIRFFGASRRRPVYLSGRMLAQSLSEVLGSSRSCSRQFRPRRHIASSARGRGQARRLTLADRHLDHEASCRRYTTSCPRSRSTACIAVALSPP